MPLVRPLSRRERALFWVTATVAICGLGYAYVIEPVVVKWTAAREEVTRLEREHAELKRLLANRDTIEAAFDTHMSGLDDNSTSESPELQLIRDVEGLAARHGLNVTGIKPLRVRTVRGLDRLGVQLNARTTNHEFVDFLFALQQPSAQLLCEDLVVTVGRERPPLSITTTLSRLARQRSHP